MSELRKMESFSGTYRDIGFEIRKWSMGERYPECWAFYIWVCVEQFPEELRAQLLPQTFYTNFGSKLEADGPDNPLNDLEWHGGMTYCRIDSTEPFTSIKAGCDYQHLCDQGRIYDQERVHGEAQRCINSLYEQHPNLVPMKTLWEEFRKKFPKENSEFRRFDRNGEPLKERAPQ